MCVLGGGGEDVCVCVCVCGGGGGGGGGVRRDGLEGYGFCCHNLYYGISF